MNNNLCSPRARGLSMVGGKTMILAITRVPVKPENKECERSGCDTTKLGHVILYMFLYC